MHMIREAKIEDAGAIADIIVTTWQTAYTGIIDADHPGTMRREKYVPIMEKNISDKLEVIFVYEEDGAVRGFISGKNPAEGYDCETVGFYILPEFQGRGVGTEMLRRMMEHFKEQGCRSMIVWTLLGAENNFFYKNRSGVPLEKKDLEIGGRTYPGVGFVFEL